MNERKKELVWVGGLFAVLLAISAATCWNVLSDPEQVLAFNDGNIESVLSPTFHFPEALVRIWDNQLFFGAGGKQFPLSFASLVESIGPVFARRMGQPLLLALCGVATYWALRRFRFRRPAAALTAAILVNSGWATTFAFTGLVARPLALAFAFLAIGFAERGRVCGRWLPYAIGGGCLGLGISEVADVGALLAISAAFVFWWTHLANPIRPQTSMQESGKKKSEVGIQNPASPSLWSVVCRLWPLLPRFALFVTFSVLLSWQTLNVMSSSYIQGVGQGSEETPAARFAWATQWSIPPTELWNTVSGSYFGTTMRSDTTPYWGKLGRGEGWEDTKQGFRNFSLTGWHFGVIPCILFLALPLWMFLTRKEIPPHNSMAKITTPRPIPSDKVNQRPDSGGPSREVEDSCPAPRVFAWMVLTGSALALMLMVGKYFFAYHLLWQLPFFGTIRNPEKWNGPFMLFAGLGIAFMLDRLCRSLPANPASESPALPKASRALNKNLGKMHPRITTWTAIGWAAFAMAFLGLMIAFWTQTDQASFIEARTRDGYGAAAALIWNSALNASFKVFLLAALFGGTTLWLARRLGQGKPPRPWIFLGMAAALALGDLMVVNRSYAIPHKYAQYLVPNPLSDYMDTHRTEGRLKLMPPQHPLLNNLRLSLLQIKGYDVFEPISVARMPADYGALFKTLEANPTRLWTLGAIRYFLTLPGGLQQLNQMDGNRGRFVERLSMGVSVINESYIPVATAPPGQKHLRLVEFTGALPVYRLVSSVTNLPDTVAGNEEALKRLALPGFDVTREAVVQSDRPLDLPGIASTGVVAILEHEPAQAKVQVTTEQPGLLVRAVKYDPDWKITLDGESVALHRVDFLFQGVVIPAGRHTVTFAYAPSLSNSALALASRGLLLLMVGAFLLQWRRFNGQPPDAPILVCEDGTVVT